MGASPSQNGRTIALIVAGGRGSRAGEGLAKQYRPLGGKPVLRRTILAFLRHPEVDEVRVVIHADDQELYEAAVADLELPPPIPGGAERQDSVRQGLEALDGGDGNRIVLIHDAARPLVSAALIDRCLAKAAEQRKAGETVALVPALPVNDSLRRGRDRLEAEVDRAGLLRMQTPQCFDLRAIRSAHQAARFGASDDAAVAMQAGIPVAVVEGDETNLKLTTADDFARAQAMIRTSLSPRTGFGFDVHAFKPGDHVWIGGVRIPHSHALKGHSDADVALHALTDALLGAIAAGDIGDHFPPNDPKWRGAPSHLFLEHARDLVERAGGRIEHVDVTIICEAPKIGPHRYAMRSAIAGMLRLPLTRVSVKATTTERLGFTGRREGIAAQAVATVRLEDWE